MENKIQELTEKLLKDGVEKGNAEAEKIIAAANEKAAQIVADAKAQAEEIAAAAQKNTQNMEENMKSEIKMYAAQALNALKSEIANVVAAAFMEEMGITHLKYYIGTHGHLDHIGGACVILSRFDVDMVIVPHERVIRAIQGSVWTEEERAAAAAASYCVLPAGGRIYLGSVPFDCIGPITVKSVRTTDTKENDNSLVLRALAGSKTILLTGDATVNEFNAIMRAYPDSIQCDVFKNTHHAGELSDQQIKAIAPKIVVFSTSSLRLPSNRYRQLFEKLGSEIYITAERINGNVTLYTDGETIAVTCQYENNRAAWDKAHGAAK